MAIALMGLLVAAAVWIAVVAWQMVPRQSGTLTAPGLHHAVMLGQDDADITHIRAESARDALFALGWVHARERGWQLAFNRRLMHGRLSEVLGPATLDIDKLMRTLGIMPAARAQLRTMPAGAVAQLQAYADGINSFLTHGNQEPSPEFLLLGTRPDGWDPADSVAWALMMALDLGGNWGTEFARLSAAEVLDNTALWQLFPPPADEAPASSVDLPAFYRELGVYAATAARLPSPGPAPARPSDTASSGPQAIPSNGSDHATSAARPALQRWADDVVANLGFPGGRGSNNWGVLGGETRSGAPLLANDPHLELSAPAIWYIASLQAPSLTVAGATIPGLPFVVIGRTAEAAWTFTNTGPDVQDLYLEQLHPDDPDQYRTPEGWQRFEQREERIRVKGEDDVVLQVRRSRHGPVLSDVQSRHALLDRERYVLALRWSALDENNHTVVAGLNLNRANSVPEMLAAGALHHSPMQSVIMADTAGRVAFKAMGRVPLRHADNDLAGVAPAPGWDARYDWIGWLPYAETPQELAPTRWVATANQRVVNPDYPYFLGQDWHPDYRYQRILDRLEADAPHDVATMRAIQGDEVSLAAQRLQPWLSRAADDWLADLDTAGTPTESGSAQPAAEKSLARAIHTQIDRFDGTMAADAATPLIFVAWADTLTRQLIRPRVGAERFDAWYGERHFRTTLEAILEQDLGHWCQPLGCREQSRQALRQAMLGLASQYGNDPTRWRWGEAHPALSVHRPLGEVALLAPWFNVSVPSGGDHFTINVGQYRATGDLPYANRQAASLRLIFDLADLENSRFIYQTGQSGLVFSPRYRDMRDAWARISDRPLRVTTANWSQTLRLTP